MKNNKVREALVELYLKAEEACKSGDITFFKINEYFTSINDYIIDLENENKDLQEIIERVRIDKYISKC